MKKATLIAIGCMVLFIGCEQITAFQNKVKAADKTLRKQSVDFSPIPVTYPKTLTDSTIVDHYHGKKVVDPFRWLEDDHATATKEWTSAQNQVTFNYLDKIPFRKAISNRLEKMWSYERHTAPFKKGDYYYYFKNDGLQNQAILYRQKNWTDTPQMILNPNQFSNDGTSSLGNYSFSKNGQYLAYEISEGGSDWRSIRIKNLATEDLLEEQINWVKFSNISWFEDGFFYCRYPAPNEEDKLSGKNEFHQVYYHLLGTPQSDDDLVFADRSQPNHGFLTKTTSDERFLIVQVWESTSGNALHFKDLKNKQSGFHTIYEEFDADLNVIDNLGDKLLVLTNYKANNKRLVAISSKKPEEAYWEEIISESKDKLENVDLAGDQLVATYLHNASSQLKLFQKNGNLITEIALPGIGTVSTFNGQKNATEAFYAFTSFTHPNTIYQLDLTSQQSTVFKKPQIDFDMDAYETKQVWYKSYDGTKIPMFITHKKGLTLDGKRPTLLYAYGGFDISIRPQFNLTRLNLGPIFLENDGIYAVANIRGGGEFGKEWHKAGTKDKKQNVFNDFQAAAEYLMDQNYTNSKKLAIYGRSNGGLLVGACMTQRPDLYAVALPAVGVLDMLRYDQFTIGRAWATDYGLSEKEQEFDYLYSYSPLHNADPALYPATLVTTADHDDRVVPAHSFKFAAAVQQNQKGKAPILIRVENSAGHGAGKPTAKKIEEATDILSFSFYNLKENVVYEQELLK